MRITVDLPKVREISREIVTDVDRAVTATMDEVAQGLKGDLRAQVRGAGLGDKVANAWRSRRYPEGKVSADAAAFVWTNAANIIDGFTRGATIRPVNGRRYLAIPTENVPRRPGRRGMNRQMTPDEVETTFNQDLKFERTKKGSLIAFIDAVQAKSGQGYRRATKKRLAQGRTQQSVVMFFFVPVAQLQKRLNPDEIVDAWAARVPGLLATHWS